MLAGAHGRASVTDYPGSHWDRMAADINAQIATPDPAAPVWVDAETMRGVTLFVVTRGWDYEGEMLVGAFHSEDAAKLAAEKDSSVWTSAAHFVYPTPLNELAADRPHTWRLLRGTWSESRVAPEGVNG